MKRAVKNVVKGRQGPKGSNNAVFTPTSTDHYSRCSTAQEGIKIRARNRRPLWICSKEQLSEKAKGQRMSKGKNSQWRRTLTVRTANWTESNYIKIRV